MEEKFEDQTDIKLEKQNYIKENFEDFEVIGSGGFGTIYKAKCVQSNKYVAIKKMTIHDDDQSYLREKKIFQLNHDNLVKYYQWFMIDNEMDQKDVYIVMELVQTDLSKLFKESIKENKTIEYINLIEYFLQIVKGVRYLHQNSIVHRDIKPQNILIQSHEKEKFIVKIADFNTIKDTNVKKSITNYNSQHYTAPELQMSEEDREELGLQSIDDKALDLKKMDIYSIGVTILEGFCVPKQLTFSNILKKNKYYNIIENNIQNTQISNLIKKMVDIDPSKRPNIQEVYEVLQDAKIEYQEKQISMQQNEIAELKNIKDCYLRLKTQNDEQNLELKQFTGFDKFQDFIQFFNKYIKEQQDFINEQKKKEEDFQIV